MASQQSRNDNRTPLQTRSPNRAHFFTQIPSDKVPLEKADPLIPYSDFLVSNTPTKSTSSSNAQTSSTSALTSNLGLPLKASSSSSSTFNVYHDAFPVSSSQYSTSGSQHSASNQNYSSVAYNFGKYIASTSIAPITEPSPSANNRYKQAMIPNSQDAMLAAAYDPAMSEDEFAPRLVVQNNLLLNNYSVPLSNNAKTSTVGNENAEQSNNQGSSDQVDNAYLHYADYATDEAIAKFVASSRNSSTNTSSNAGRHLDMEQASNYSSSPAVSSFYAECSAGLGNTMNFPCSSAYNPVPFKPRWQLPPMQVQPPALPFMGLQQDQSGRAFAKAQNANFVSNFDGVRSYSVENELRFKAERLYVPTVPAFDFPPLDFHFTQAAAAAVAQRQKPIPKKKYTQLLPIKEQDEGGSHNVSNFPITPNFVNPPEHRFEPSNAADVATPAVVPALSAILPPKSEVAPPKKKSKAAARKPANKDTPKDKVICDLCNFPYTSQGRLKSHRGNNACRRQAKMSAPLMSVPAAVSRSPSASPALPQANVLIVKTNSTEELVNAADENVDLSVSDADAVGEDDPHYSIRKIDASAQPLRQTRLACDDFMDSLMASPTDHGLPEQYIADHGLPEQYIAYRLPDAPFSDPDYMQDQICESGSPPKSLFA